MTIFQKLTWMAQMGIHTLCAEKPHKLGQERTCGAGSARSLSALDKKLLSSKSALSMTATHPLGGIGVVSASVMCVLESPSAMEDKTGVALSGPEGELLKKMLSAIGLDINVQTYVAYLSPWRAPGARVMTPFEMQEGLLLLNERIQLIQPKILLLLGANVVRAMLNIPMGQARSKIQNYHGISVFSTFAPNFLLKNTDYKKGAWADLKKLQGFLDKS